MTRPGHEINDIGNLLDNREVKQAPFRDGSRWVAKSLQESILIDFDFIWKVLLSNRNFATLIDPPLSLDTVRRRHK